ncbi:hypothetical protein HDK90DRAFT_307282 [Phyllosticta capitalensis]|uniref:Uncharacterized protein n=1 Tax=Phyllosticta capitalensis TaxID=121624 RepID=A0ABR1YKP5_9PEZI
MASSRYIQSNLLGLSRAANAHFPQLAASAALISASLGVRVVSRVAQPKTPLFLVPSTCGCLIDFWLSILGRWAFRGGPFRMCCMSRMHPACTMRLSVSSFLWFRFHAKLMTRPRNLDRNLCVPDNLTSSILERCLSGGYMSSNCTYSH